MTTCPSCGSRNPDQARFCLDCGRRLSPRPSPSDSSRRLVTVLFADVVGSTALGERHDPETVRFLMGKYFAAARASIEKHGGTVEKFIGDAVMAVFGVPMLHEDDAVRAVRAAIELRASISELNEELAARGARVELRIGINTGEVVAGGEDDAETLVAGDAVNVAARLEQAASAGSILIGETTHRLVRDHVRVELVRPIAAKGKTQPVLAHRVVELAEPTGESRAVSFVGRRGELKQLVDAFERAVSERACHLVTLVGPPGVGKSRLARELTAQLPHDARVMRGRCLPYGEGTTFGAIAEMVRTRANADRATDTTAETVTVRRLVELLRGERDPERISSLVGSAIGLTEEWAPQEELFWGIRRWLEAQARAGSLIGIIEDIHWAEPTLLDLLEYVAESTRDAPMLLVCTARPELLDSRPEWAGATSVATALLLEPLPTDAIEDLVVGIVGERRLPPGTVGRILDAAEGNPLFAEEIVRMLVDDGLFEAQAEAIPIPTSLRAVIAARLDRLARPQRIVAERAAVAGRIFERGAVTALVPDTEQAAVPEHIGALVRKQVVYPDKSPFTLDEAFRFRHVLIRDVAYLGVSKEARAELHERFGDWLESVSGERIAEHAELVGYHYEQAHRYRLELGLEDAKAGELADRAASHLAEAGRRAYLRKDGTAAAKLLTRAVSLMQPGPARREAMLTRVSAFLNVGHYPEARVAADELITEARAENDGSTVWKARLLEYTIRTWSDPTVPAGLGDALVTQALPVFDAAHDDHGMALASYVLAEVHLGRAHFEGVRAESERGIPYAARTDSALEALLRAYTVGAALWGPTTVPELLATADRELSQTASHAQRAILLAYRSLGHAMAGDARSARLDIAEALRLRVELGGQNLAGAYASMPLRLTAGLGEYVLGNLQAAFDAFERSAAALERVGETGARSSVVGNQALVAFDLGHPEDDVLSLAEQCRKLSASDDVISHVQWRQVVALVAARAERMAEARDLIDEATELVNASDDLYLRGVVARDSARIAELAGERDKAIEKYRAALDEFERKGDVMDAARMRDAISRLVG